MELNKIELKKITHDFSIISSRMMRVKYDEYNIVLKKFIAFIEENEIINDYVVSGKTGEYDAEADYMAVTRSNGEKIFDFGPSAEEESFQIYSLLKFILEKNADISLGFSFVYGVSKRQEVVKEFNDRVLLVLIQNIEGHLTKIGYDMGMDEKTYWNVTGGQVNIANDNATVNAVQNNGASVEEINKLVDGILDNLGDVDSDTSETIVDSVTMIKEELMKPTPKRAILANGIKLLAPIVSIVNGVPLLADNIQALITYVSTLIP